MRTKIATLAALLAVGLTVSGCHYGRPGHDSDRSGHHGHHRGDHDGGDRHD
ncbi:MULTISPECIES: hypothetical protein [unclassified Sphingomonas]|jgi:hypothetical protein|uniref:hypothetical protein n=1 Tax=unclassified Sphingomonas TaxID=196159 RepID=UPI0022699F1F|nr:MULTISPECIES: hypothetical protein [unclassified Sphingomonas]